MSAWGALLLTVRGPAKMDAVLREMLGCWQLNKVLKGRMYLPRRGTTRCRRLKLSWRGSTRLRAQGSRGKTISPLQGLHDTDVVGVYIMSAHM